MYILRGLRYPTALAFGLLFTGAIFWSLWSFTNVTFEISAIETVPFDFKRTRIDTPVEIKNEEVKIIKPDVMPPVDIVGIVDPEVSIATVIDAFPIEPVITNRPVLGVSADRSAMPKLRINPEYPQRAITQNIEGWVKVQFTITGTGAVTDVTVVENSPSSIFDDAAIKAVSRWRYEPQVEGAVAVERVGVQTILRFDLEEE